MSVTETRRAFLRGVTTLPLIGGGVTVIGNPIKAAEPRGMADRVIIQGGGAGPFYFRSFASSKGDWIEAAMSMPAHVYVEQPVITGVMGGGVRIIAAPGKDYPAIIGQIPGLTAGRQYTATIAFQNRSGAPIQASALTDPTRGSNTALNEAKSSLAAGNLSLVFTASKTTMNYIRIRVFAEGGGGESVDVASISISESSGGGILSSGFWRTDQRPILSEFIAEFTQRVFPRNPRGFLPALVGNAFNAAHLRSVMLARADQVGAACRSAGAQGLIIWDLVGQEFGHATTYLGAPDEIAVWAPEFDVVLDQYIKRLQSYGLRVGTTLRPQHVPYGMSFPTIPSANIASLDPFVKTDAKPPNRIHVAFEVSPGDWQWMPWEGHHPGTGPGQVPIRTGADQTAARDRLIKRISYCKARWGMSMFYVDSTVWEYGQELDASMWAPIQAAHPDVLIMPENETYGYFDYTVPYGVLRLGDVGPGYLSEDPHAMMLIDFQQASQENYDDAKQRLIGQYKARRLLLMCHWGDRPQLARISKIMNA